MTSISQDHSPSTAEAQESLAAHRFKAIADTRHHLVLGRNQRGRITFFNQGCETLTGYTSEELVGKSFAAHLIPKTKRKAHREHFRGLTEAKISIQETGEILTKTKQRLVIGWTHTPILDASGTLQEIVSVGYNITNHIQVMAALQMSEEIMHQVLERIPDIITIINREGKIQYINRSPPGFSKESVIGADATDFVPPERRMAMRQSLDRVLQNGEAQSVQSLVTDGQWYSIRRIPIKRDGRVTTILSIATNITESKRAEETLRESEATFRGLVEHSLQGISLLQGVPSRMIYANPAISRILGYTQEELARLPLGAMGAIANQEDRERFLKAFWSYAAGQGDPPQLEVRATHKDGSLRWVEVTAILVDYKGKPAQLVTFNDITERKQTQKALQESEHKYRTLVERSQLGIIIIQGSPSRIIFANPAMLHITGFTTEELVTSSPDFLKALTHPDDLKQFIEKSVYGT
ncbi:MAG: PAS domain S-box protein, partial [Promethearchaeota archaeon]